MASKRGKRRKECSGKVGHKNRDAAMRARRRLSSNKAGAYPMNVYKCQYCGQWHIGHKPHVKRTRRKDFI